MKHKRNYTALIKDLEQQIDYLVGYTSGGAHWKMEYHVRKTMIDHALEAEEMPEHIREKINRILQKLYDLRNGTISEQPYLAYTESHTVVISEYGAAVGSFDLP